MINTGKFAGKTVFVTGASRGIGKAIAMKIAKDGANVVIAAKTVEPHKKLDGTIYTAAKEVESVGGKCLPLQVDIRDEDQVKNAIKSAVDKFGGIDILVNNASAISLTGTVETDMKRYDLMHHINTRGTFMVSKYAIDHLKNSSHAHILNLSPPLEMKPRWFHEHVAYTMAKYGMSMCVLGMAEELKPQNIAVNALWPRTAIWTAAMGMLGGEESSKFTRKVDIMADAAYAVLSKDPRKHTGNFYVDEDVILGEGITDLDQYAVAPGNELMTDFFLPEKYLQGSQLDVNQLKSSAGSAPTGSKTEEIFKFIESVVSDDLKKEINAVLSFVIGGQKWYLDANAARPFKVSKGETPNPDVTLTTDEETFIKMAKGETKATNAFMAGKLKVKGNIAVAMKAEKLFGKLKSKL